MHLTLKLEATKPAAKNFLQQQGKFDEIGMKYPGELYERSVRPY